MTGVHSSARLISTPWHGLRHDRRSCTRKALPAGKIDGMLSEASGGMRLTPAARAPALRQATESAEQQASVAARRSAWPSCASGSAPRCR
jgi:hypothetical protein